MRWPIWGKGLGSDGRQCFDVTVFARTGTQAHDHMGGLHWTHLAVLAGTDFFTAEVLTLRGLVTYYVLFSLISRAAEWLSPGSPFTRMSRG